MFAQHISTVLFVGAVDTPAQRSDNLYGASDVADRLGVRVVVATSLEHNVSDYDAVFAAEDWCKSATSAVLYGEALTAGVPIFDLSSISHLSEDDVCCACLTYEPSAIMRRVGDVWLPSHCRDCAPRAIREERNRQRRSLVHAA